MPNSKNDKKNDSKKSDKNEHKYNTRSKKECKRNDSDDASDDEEMMDQKEFQELLYSIFPSKHLKNKLKQMDNVETADKIAKASKVSKASKATKQNKSSTTSSSPKTASSTKNKLKSKNEQKSKSKKTNSKSKKEEENEIVHKKKKSHKDDDDDNTEDDEEDDDEVEEDSEDCDTVESDDSDEEEDEDSDEEVDDEDVDEEESEKFTKLDIIFTFKNADDMDEDEYDEDYEEDDSEDDSDDETDDDEDMSDEEEDSEDEDDTEEEGESSSSESSECGSSSSTPKASKLRSSGSVKTENKEDDMKIINKFKDMCKELKGKNKNSKILKDLESTTKEMEKKMKKKEEKKNKKVKQKNCKRFSKLLANKNTLNDYKFFKEKLNIYEQEKVIKELEEIQNMTTVNKPYKLQLLESNVPQKFKSCAFKKINSLKSIHPGAGEYYKIKSWIDSFLQIPFNKVSNLPVNIDDGIEKCHEFMENAQNKLNESVYGLEDAKVQIMQMIGQWISNPESIGTAIAVKGPMGTGKTTLIKDGVSKILNREFAFIPLGGATDSSFLEGHSYTYEGSTYGKIVDILIQTKTCNPVIYFDELDKVSDTPKGEEIISILTHLTDTSQNTQFHDKYFSEIDFDLSKCLFIFSYNDESKVNPILKDRMYNIETKGYDTKDKITISRNYLIPKIEEQIKIEKDSVLFDDDVFKYIIENFTKGEKGVRNLKRCIEIIFTKLNLYRLMKPNSKLFNQDIISDVKFPFNVSKENVDKLIQIQKNESSRESMQAMYL